MPNKFTVKDLKERLNDFPDDMELVQPGDHGDYHFIGADSLYKAVLIDDDGEERYDNEIGGENYFEGMHPPDDFAEWRRVVAITS